MATLKCSLVGKTDECSSVEKKKEIIVLLLLLIIKMFVVEWFLFIFFVLGCLAPFLLTLLSELSKSLQSLKDFLIISLSTLSQVETIQLTDRLWAGDLKVNCGYAFLICVPGHPSSCGYHEDSSKKAGYTLIGGFCIFSTASSRSPPFSYFSKFPISFGAEIDVLVI